MAQHDRTDHKMEVYTCPLCPHSTRDYHDIRRLKAHCRSMHDKNTYTCEVCGETFHSKNGLYQHVQYHKKKNIICEKCGKVFVNQTKLKTHEKAVHGKLKVRISKFYFPVIIVAILNPLTELECQICRKVISGKRIQNLMRSHLRTHQEPKFTCDFCGKKFRQKVGLQGHLNWHQGIYEHKCAPCNMVSQKH